MASTPSRRSLVAGLLAAAVLMVSGPGLDAQERFVTVASTTSTEQSGLFAHIVPSFRRATGIDVRVVAVGTGQALAIGAKGDADAILVHDRAGEDAFVAAGHGIDRRTVMENDFVLVGPGADPAGARGAASLGQALQRIAAAEAPFVSRGDDSGTHRMELRLWARADIPRPGGPWYREVGQGMGPTLNVAAALFAYTLADRATWATFANRGNLAILRERDPLLANPYGSILVNPAKGPHIKAADARAWHDWLTSEAGRQAIASFRIGEEQLFFPASTPPRD